MKQNLPDTRMGMNPDTKAFEVWLTKYLKVKNSTKKFSHKILYAVLFWIIIAGQIGGIIGLIVVVKQTPNNQFWYDEVGSKICGFIIIFGGILACIVGPLWISKRNEDYRKQYENASHKFYNAFWNFCYKDKLSLIFEGLNDPNAQELIFHAPNGDKIIWRTYEAPTDTSSKLKLHADLLAYSQKLKDCEGVVLTRCDHLETKAVRKTYDLATPSMSFNKRFKISTLGENQHAAGKIFDPSVVQYFDQMTSLSPRADAITFHDGYAVVEWCDHIGGKAQLTDGLNDFGELKMNSQNAAKIITKKIKGDYEWFFENLAMLQPFELYQF